jgi:hypothetical protein
MVSATADNQLIATAPWEPITPSLTGRNLINAYPTEFIFRTFRSLFYDKV